MNDITLVCLGDIKNEISLMFPMGVLYLASYLENCGFKVECKDIRIIPYINQQQFFNAVLKHLKTSANVIGFSCTTEVLPFAIQIAKSIKINTPHKIIILGGQGLAEVEEEVLKAFPFIDIIVVGEGELTLADIMHHIKERKNLDDVKGIVYRNKDNIFCNPARERIKDLDSLPMPAYSKINIEDYGNFSIVTERGCPYHCTFCSEGAFWGHSIVHRSINGVLDEISMLKNKYNINNFTVNDAVFTTSAKRVYEFCSGLKERRLDIKWACHGRIGLIDEGMMKNMANSGCEHIGFGVESGSNKVLKEIQKIFTIEQAETTINKACTIFRNVQLYYMWGFPSEELKDFIDTLCSVYRLMNKNKNINILFSRLVPYFNTRLYKENISNIKRIKNRRACILPFSSYSLPKWVFDYPTIFPHYLYLKTGSTGEKKEMLNCCWRETYDLVEKALLDLKKNGAISDMPNKSLQNKGFAKNEPPSYLAKEFFRAILHKLENQKDLFGSLKSTHDLINKIIRTKSFYKVFSI